MSLESVITSDDRVCLVQDAIKTANEKLKEHNLEVGYPTQWPPEAGDSPDVMDQRPDVDLKMFVSQKWVDIDIIYLRQMPQEPEKLKTVAQLADDIFNKALAHRDAMHSPEIFISSSGSKFNLGKVQSEQFSIDQDGYIRIGNIRIVNKMGDNWKPIKAADIRCHTIVSVQIDQIEDDKVVIMSDEFDSNRTDGKSGMYCPMKKAIDIARECILPARRQETESYEQEIGGSRYIPIERSL